MHHIAPNIDDLTHGQALLLDSDLAPLFQFKWTSWGLLLGTKITPRGWIFWTMTLLILKSSHQDLSNEGSNTAIF